MNHIARGRALFCIVIEEKNIELIVVEREGERDGAL